MANQAKKNRNNRNQKRDDNFLHPGICKMLFARLQAGDEGAATTIALRVIQSDCKVIGVPSNLSTQAEQKLEDACATQNVKLKRIRFEIFDSIIQKASRDIQNESQKPSNNRPRRAEGHRRKPQKGGLQLDAQGRDAEGRSRRKAHSNLSDEEKAQRRREREAKRADKIARDKELRQKMKSSSGKKE